MKPFFVALLFTTVLFSCKDSNKEKYIIKTPVTSENKELHPGKKLMETYCYACHSPSASHDARIAPPMIAIKKHYINSNTSKGEFMNSMQEWIKNPTEENAKMFGAVNRFGVMPKTPYPEETIKQISDYMFDNTIEQPEWFEAHFKEEKAKNKGGIKTENIQNIESNFEMLPNDKRGLKYALTTKSVLGKNLIGTIQKKGTIEALSFCNEKAYPLTDSMSVVHKAKIKRVSDKPRNPKNQASNKELVYINTFKKDIENNIESKPIVDEVNGEIHFYYPIKTNKLCLQCHGKPNESIEHATLKKIATLYPKDKAIGYDINEVRGVWHVSFEK